MLQVTKFLLLFFVLTVVSTTVNAREPLKHTEGVFEGEPRVFFLGRTLTGYALNKQCPTCEEVKVKVTPNSKAFLNGNLVELSKIASTTMKPVFMKYNLETLQVTQMLFYTKSN